ncbi:MAG: DUF2459 domain-containing protein [Gammaproteobacteria bacterium]|nr:DUF2459 domain-containing protein [Gammaproteobacteria bacterium]
MFLHGGCALKPADLPTAIECEKTRTFYIIGHGWHTGIAVHREDLEEYVLSLENDSGNGDYIEIGWGDEQFYQAKKVTAGLVLQAILWPTPTVLHVVDLTDSPQRNFPGSVVMEISVPQTGYEKLLAYISESFARTNDNNITSLGPGLYGESRFYRANGVFHAFNTCNTWVIRAIERTGYPVTNVSAVTAEDVLSQLQRGLDVTMGCYSVRRY